MDDRVKCSLRITNLGESTNLFFLPTLKQEPFEFNGKTKEYKNETTCEEKLFSISLSKGLSRNTEFVINEVPKTTPFSQIVISCETDTSGEFSIMFDNVKIVNQSSDLDWE